MPNGAEVSGSRAGDEPGAVFSREPGPDPYSAEGFSSYKETLGELGRDTALEPIKDFQGAIKSLVEAQKMIGGSLRLPAEGLSDEDRTKAVGELKSKLIEAGVLDKTPESPQGYEIQMPQVEGWKVNQGLYDSFREAAHNLSCPPGIAQGLFDWYVKIQADEDAKEEGAFSTMKENLKKDWGVLHPRKMEASRRAALKYLGQDGDDLISQLPPAVANRLIRGFAQIGEPLLEEGYVSGEPQPFENKDTLISKINELVNTKEFKEGNKDKVNEYLKLNRALSILQVEERR